MSTVGEKVLERLDALERGVEDLQVAETTEALRRALSQEIAELREQLTQSGPEGRGSNRSLYSSKEFIPEKLGNDYKQAWRAWSYKVRDWMRQYHAYFPEKLEAVEAMTQEVPNEYLQQHGIPATAETELRRFLVHRLEGDPAEVVRSMAKKNGLEQYRCLAQLCDPSAGGRNWADSQQLYHPSPASSLQGLPSRIAEWEILESRCRSRSGEEVPGTFRTLALIAMCPKSLYEVLITQPDVATGTISYDKLK